MLRIAIKMLIGDRAKYFMLISALTFASMLMTQQTGIFCGLLRWTTSNIRNSQVKVWVVDPKVEQLNEIKPMRDTDLARVRSVTGVSWAVPMYQGVQQARLADGKFKSIILIGLDATTLIGAPPIIHQGNFQDLRQSHAVIIDQEGAQKLSLENGSKIGIGDLFEINDQEARVVGICYAEKSFFGYPYVYTTYERAINFSSKNRKNLSFILVEPALGITPEQVSRRIEQETGLKAYTQEEFFWSTIWWYVANTGIPISFGTTIVLGFVVGIAVAGQTFYMFILENLRNLGALKAMGASTRLLSNMLILQAFLIGFIGFGLGLGLTSVFGFFATKSQATPFFLPWQVLIVTGTSVIFICSFAALIGILKIRKLEAAEVFRA